MNIEETFDRVPKKMMKWAIREKGLPEVIARAVMSLHRKAKAKVRMG